MCKVSIEDHNGGLTVMRLDPGDEIKVRRMEDGRVQVACRPAGADDALRRLVDMGAKWDDYRSTPEYRASRDWQDDL